MPAEVSLALTILYVRDLQSAAALYDAVFGWKKTVDEPVYVEYDVATAVRIGLMPQPHTRQFLGSNLGARTYSDECPRAEIYLQVRDLGQVIERLEAHGVTCVDPLRERDWGDRVAYYLDPDGYVLAVAQSTN